MPPRVAKELRKKKRAESVSDQGPAAFREEPVQGQSCSPPEAIQARIADRAYALYVERGCRQGYALDDWLEAEREILGLECNA
jgi:hypothetical protein